MTAHDAQSLIGKEETHQLEFKSAEILKKPAAIAREVVAFLNADGGYVWVGIGEHEGKADALETIPKVEAAASALRDHFLDVIEPAPIDQEVRVEPTDGRIRIRVTKGIRGPYALRRDKGRQYVIRVGARVREMDRDELASAFHSTSRGASPGGIPQGESALKDAIDAQLKTGTRQFWWRLVPNSPLAIDFENADQATRKFFEDLLTNPSASGNRRNGWTMVLFHDSLPKLTTRSVIHRFGKENMEHGIEVLSDGTMTFWAPRVRLDRDWDDDGTTVFPFALLELPVSSFRIASRILSRFHLAGSVACGAVIGGMKGATLRPGSPTGPTLPWKHPVSFDEAALVVKPFSIEAQQIVASPDAAAYRLVRRIYEEFNLAEADIPAEFDRDNHVLRLPT